MANDLKWICDHLYGYNDEARFEVLKATKTSEGTWELTIKKLEPVTKKPSEVADDND